MMFHLTDYKEGVKGGVPKCGAVKQGRPTDKMCPKCSEIAKATLIERDLLS